MSVSTLKKKKEKEKKFPRYVRMTDKQSVDSDSRGKSWKILNRNTERHDWRVGVTSEQARKPDRISWLQINASLHSHLLHNIYGELDAENVTLMR